jgi:hypothetical protein
MLNARYKRIDEDNVCRVLAAKEGTFASHFSEKDSLKKYRPLYCRRHLDPRDAKTNFDKYIQKKKIFSTKFVIHKIVDKFYPHHSQAYHHTSITL